MDKSAELLALDLSPDEDIRAFSAWLWQQGIHHRVYEQLGRQRLVVFQPQHVKLVAKVYAELSSGRLSIEQVPRHRKSVSVESSGTRLNEAWRRQPVCLGLVGVCLIVALFSVVDPHARLAALLTFTPVEQVNGRLVLLPLAETLSRGEVWRLLTPIFLHFGVVHLAFNMLWLFEVGRRIEQRQGGGRLFALVVLCGVGGNLAQYMASREALFGGMSGVIYGLLGYVWLWGRLRPAEDFHLPPGIMLVMIGWLVLCAVGLIEALGLGAIANAAHLSGLACGLLSATLLAILPTGDSENR